MTPVYLNDVEVERRLLQEGVLVMSVKEGRLDLFAEVGRDGFSIMGETYPDIYLDGDAVRFQREAADRVQEETVVIMPSVEIAEIASGMLRDERGRYA